MATIDRLIVLMMENRSFDHLLGMLRTPDYAIEGLTQEESNVDATGEPVRVNNQARYAGDLTPDPGHDFDDVSVQLYGTTTPVAGQEPTMTGFITSYGQICQGDNLAARRIMRCFAPERLPVITTLAKQFCVCDHWFASVPGPTLPNRLFAHCGTSGGRLDLSPDFIRGFTTIYQVLQEANAGATVYADGWSSAATFPFLLAHQDQSYGTIEQFFEDCADNELPKYSFLEPRFSTRDDGGVFHPQNDQHPDSDVFEGEKLIRRIYEAIRGNKKVWERSMLIITYDEHGGIYDHVPPPRTIAPDNHVSEHPRFDFTRLGVRVPAVVVSPYIDPGTIRHNVFDHTSFLATALDLFGQGRDERLGRRVGAAANVRDVCITRDTPRKDKIIFPKVDVPAPVALPPMLNNLQRVFVAQAKHLEQQLPIAARTGINPDTIQTPSAADNYCRRVFAAAKA